MATSSANRSPYRCCQQSAFIRHVNSAEHKRAVVVSNYRFTLCLVKRDNDPPSQKQVPTSSIKWKYRTCLITRTNNTTIFIREQWHECTGQATIVIVLRRPYAESTPFSGLAKKFTDLRPAKDHWRIPLFRAMEQTVILPFRMLLQWTRCFCDIVGEEQNRGRKLRLVLLLFLLFLFLSYHHLPSIWFMYNSGRTKHNRYVYELMSLYYNWTIVRTLIKVVAPVCFCVDAAHDQ